MKMTNLAKVADLTKFCKRLRFQIISQRDGYSESGKFEKHDEFGESDGFDKISPQVEIPRNEAKRWVQQKW